MNRWYGKLLGFFAGAALLRANPLLGALIGLSVSRQMSTACSLGRPSRRKNEPGILPAAYIRSSTSTVRGKKSTPSRILRLATAVASTSVSPTLAITAPSA
jgi:hypothetical protein